MAIGMGMPMEKVRMQCMEKMVLPCGPAPPAED
jgi:splicing factor 3B subunit 5